MPEEIRLLVATHTFGSVKPAYAFSLARLTAYLTRLNVTHGVMMFEDSLVDRGRDHAAAAMLTENYTHLLFIDGDVEFPPEAAVTLLQSGKPLIGGAIPLKGPPGKFTFVPLDGPVEQCRSSKALRVKRIGTGFMLIAREVFTRMAEAYPEIHYTERNLGQTRKMQAFFEHVVRDGERYSEDYTFCERWRALGGEVWLNPFIEFGHWGGTVWRGTVGNLLRQGEGQS